MTKLFDLRGQVALVTGATGGLGTAIAGSVILTTSIAGLRGNRAIGQYSLYGLSEAAPCGL